MDVSYEDHKLPSVMTRALVISNESRLAARHSRFVTRDIACLVICDPQVRSATRDPRLVIRDLGGPKS